MAYGDGPEDEPRGSGGGAMPCAHGGEGGTLQALAPAPTHFRPASANPSTDAVASRTVADSIGALPTPFAEPSASCLPPSASGLPLRRGLGTPDSGEPKQAPAPGGGAHDGTPAAYALDNTPCGQLGSSAAAASAAASRAGGGSGRLGSWGGGEGLMGLLGLKQHRHNQVETVVPHGMWGGRTKLTRMVRTMVRT